LDDDVDVALFSCLNAGGGGGSGLRPARAGVYGWTGSGRRSHCNNLQRIPDDALRCLSRDIQLPPAPPPAYLLTPYRPYLAQLRRPPRCHMGRVWEHHYGARIATTVTSIHGAVDPVRTAPLLCLTCVARTHVRANYA